MKQVTTFKSDSGKIHETEADAWADDLTHFFLKCDKFNLAVAGQITDHIRHNGNMKHLREIITGLERSDGSVPPPLMTEIYYGDSFQPDAVYPFRPCLADVEAARPIYPIPDLIAPRIRCTGIKCSHLAGHCTADPDYQRWIKAEKLWLAQFPMSQTPFHAVAPDIQQDYLYRAETTA